MKIRKPEEKDRKAPWMLDGNFGGQQMRLFFRTEREAMAELRAVGFATLRAVRVDSLYDGERLLLGEMEATPGQF